LLYDSIILLKTRSTQYQSLTQSLFFNSVVLREDSFDITQIDFALSNNQYNNDLFRNISLGGNNLEMTFHDFVDHHHVSDF
jgi:hypothetical protein